MIHVDVTFSFLATDVEAVCPLRCHPEGDAELVHFCPSLWLDGLSVCWDIRGELSSVLNHFFSSCSPSSARDFLFVPSRLRRTGPSSTWYVSGAASLALCSISVDVLYTCTSEPDVPQQSLNWTFPALWGITCCCVMMGRSCDFILYIYILNRMVASLKTYFRI